MLELTSFFYNFRFSDWIYHTSSDCGPSFFTFTGFYERRIRRIFPALIVMLFVSLAIAYRYFLPIELSDFAASMVSAAFSVSNIHFYHQTGYFDGPSSSKPLLHTWSLAVEEQFYIFLPILLVLLRRFAPRRVDLSIYFIVALSFLASAYGAIKLSSSYFLPCPHAGVGAAVRDDACSGFMPADPPASSTGSRRSCGRDTNSRLGRPLPKFNSFPRIGCSPTLSRDSAHHRCRELRPSTWLLAPSP